MGPRVLVVDNYDSFVYNLVQELGELGAEPVVFRNDAIDVAGIRAARPDAVLISPGPGRPEDGGVSLEVVRSLAGEIPLLGVCLGHQCIGQAYGGEIVAAPHLMHGKTSEIHHDGKGLFAGLPNPFVATRYHSLVVRPESVPADLEVTATSRDGVVMGLRHRSLPVEGGAVPPRVRSDRVRARRCWPTSSDSWTRRHLERARQRPYSASPVRRAGSSTSCDDGRRRGRGGGGRGGRLTDRDVHGAAIGDLRVGGWVLGVDVPGMAPPAQVVSKVVLATRPAP